MSLRGKFHVAFGIIASLAIGLVLYGVFALSATRNLVFKLYDEPLVAVSYARAASATLNEARGLMDRALLMGPLGAADVMSSLDRKYAEISDDLWIVRQRLHDKAAQRTLDDVVVAMNDWFEAGGTILSPPPGGVTQIPMREAVDRRSARAAARLDDLVELATANGYAYRARAAAEMRTSALTLASLAGGIVALSGLFALAFVQLLIAPIRAATQIAEDVAADKRTTIAATKRRDEIGRLLTSLATMQASLRAKASQASTLLQDKQRSADTLQLTNQRFNTALNNMAHGLLMWDSGGSLAVANRRFCDIYGLDPTCVQPGKSLRDIVELVFAAGHHPDDDPHEQYADQMQIVQSRRRCTAIRTLSSGQVVAASYEPMADGGWTETHEDITERRKSEAQIVFLARHDALTELPNRVVFQERIEQALAEVGRGTGFALLYLDLDRFKEVNDTLGHPIGDGLLCAVAQRLLCLVREGDTVARLGGDEFAILQLAASNAIDATALARRVVDVVSAPYEIEGNQVNIGTSIGIALAPADGAQAAQLLKHADLAMYRAKRSGRGRWHFFEHAMDATAKARRILELELRGPALLQQLELHYQPVVSSTTMAVTGFEALLRWRHPDLGFLPPAEFIPVAEEIGMIAPIGAWVLQHACAQAVLWPSHLSIAVNLSPLQFRDNALVETVSAALQGASLAPKRLVLEITESALLKENTKTLASLHAIRDLGIRIAMDDFGTGYSSLSYLRSFPFDTIKIDRSFVSEIQTRPECIAIVRSIVSLADSLRMHTIAEGVETEEQFRALAAAGCTEIQGYLLSKPLPASQLPGLIARLAASRRLSLVALSTS
jgi:diguanylate cyclase (GGDEF)-like protein